MNRYLRLLDRRILIAVVVVVVASLTINLLWSRSASSSLTAAVRERDVARESLETSRRRLVEIRTDGVTTGEGLLARVARLESVVAASNDILTVSAAMLAVAESHGVVLEQFEPSKAGSTTEEVRARLLRGSRYSFSVRGDYQSLVKFANGILTSSKFVATIDSVSLLPAGQSGTLFEGDAILSGELVLWSLAEKALTGDAPAASQPSAAPVTSVPATSAPVTSTPVDPAADPAGAPEDGQVVPEAPAVTVPAG